MEIRCKDCLLFNNNNNYCGFWDDYDHTGDSELCDYGITQKDYDFMIKELDYDLDYWIDNY